MSGDLAVLKYNSTHLEKCRSLWSENVQHHRDIYDDQSIGGDNPGLEFDRHLEEVGEGLIWVAELNGEVVGLASLLTKGEEAEIEPLIVSKNNRNQGIGKTLVDHVIDYANNNNVSCLSVRPVARNKEAIRFFHSCGFQTLGHVQLFMWIGEAFPNQWKQGPDVFGRSFRY